MAAGRKWPVRSSVDRSAEGYGPNGELANGAGWSEGGREWLFEGRRRNERSRAGAERIGRGFSKLGEVEG